MDSHGQIICLLDHRTFSERQLARIHRVPFARFIKNRLYLRIDLRAGVSGEWLKASLRCSAFDGATVFAASSRIEDVTCDEDGNVILVSAPLSPEVPFDGYLPETATVLLETARESKAFTALNRVAGP